MRRTLLVLVAAFVLASPPANGQTISFLNRRLGDWLTDLGNLRREVTQMEPLNDERKWLLHQLAQREVCGYDACPSRVLARQHALANPLPEKKS